MSGTPLSSCSPRSSNAIPEPATRSRTVRVTSTSPGRGERRRRGADVHRDAREPAPGAGSPPRRGARSAPRALRRRASSQMRTRSGSHAPARRTSRGRRRRRRRSSVSAVQRRRASPTTPRTVPRARSSARSPSSLACSVEPTMSTKSTVARTRSASSTSRRDARDELLDRTEQARGRASGQWSALSSSTSRAPGCARRDSGRARSGRTTLSRLWTTSVGTVTSGRTSRTSSSWIVCAFGRAMRGVPAKRSTRPHHSTTPGRSATDGASAARARPYPMSSRSCRARRRDAPAHAGRIVVVPREPREAVVEHQ